MPTAPDKDCLQCHKATARSAMRNGRCPACAKATGQQNYQDRNVSDPFHKQYQTPAWRKLSDAFRRQNPICLFLEADGAQCRWPATLVHHRIAAKVRPDLFLDPKNLCALCDHHHGHTSGDPTGAKFVPAVYTLSMLPGQNLAEPSYSVAPPPPQKQVT